MAKVGTRSVKILYNDLTVICGNLVSQSNNVFIYKNLASIDVYLSKSCHDTKKMDKSLENEAKHAAERGIVYDSEKQYKQAICYYNVAACLLSKLPENSPIASKADEYRERIAQLQQVGK